MEMGMEVDARSIVRSYSFEVEQRLPEGTPAHTLGQALVAERRNGGLDNVTAPWRAFFEPKVTEAAQREPITDIIRIESEKLREKLVTFYKESPKDERLDLNSIEPTIQGVVAMVNAVNVQWQGKRKQGYSGKAKSFFHRFCGTLDSHSSLIKLLPDGNEYVSLFTGTLNAIIKASANHEKIAEGFAEGLCTISEHIEEVATHLKLLPTEDVIKLVVDLYEHVFLFLSGVMDWIMKKRSRRLLDSFTENFNDQFRDELNNINKKAARIRNIASQGAMAEGRVTRLVLEGLDRDIRLGLEGDMRHQAEMRLFAERIESRLTKAEEDRSLEFERMKNLGGSVVILLEAYAAKWLQAGGLAPSAPSTPSFQLLSTISSNSSLRNTVTSYSAEDVALNSRHLEDFFSRERIRLVTASFVPTTIGSDVILQLSEWAQGPNRSILWLDGPSTEMDDMENPLTSLAAKFIDLVGVNSLPVLSYFCEIPQTVDNNVTREMKGTISLLYALLRQMVELLLPRLETTVNLSEERFLSLDGSMGTWSEALAVFRDLTTLSPGTIYCVIDGFHWLDDKTTNLALAQLVECLRGGRLKVLFTTSGRSGCLLENLEPEETFVVNDINSVEMVNGLDDHGVLDL
ncbi:hypothetical protein VP1G_00696 [Cytospora mali]|uniref:DUF7708 domain-containing protein n=1 Tax=Cytospora mali TaxID=578113 RepID=A0A194UP13_CYTMA|nr:hypothetical protein VP1G_00696 [Valsa mali var. pyri (nom. inval.)]